MQATAKRFVMDSNFKLGDLLKLRLDTCVDACTEIVDRAQKELLVEKVMTLPRKEGRCWQQGGSSVKPGQAGLRLLLLQRAALHVCCSRFCCSCCRRCTRLRRPGAT